MNNFFSNAVKSGYFMYMAEAEGLDNLVSTRQAKLNAVVKDARRQAREIGAASVNLYEICANHNLDSLSFDEMQYIEQQANK